MAENLPEKAKRQEAWRVVAEWVSGMFVLAHLVAGAWELWDDKEKWSKIFNVSAVEAAVSSHKVWALLLVTATCVWAMARFPRLRTMLLGSKHTLPMETPLLFRGLQPYHAGEHLPGRRIDGERCWLLLQERAFLVLEGESGCGKSSLLNAVLIPKLQELYRVIRVRLVDEPYSNTVQALQQIETAKRARSADAEGLSAAFSAIARRKSTEKEFFDRGRPLLLCIDQFEELFGAVNDRIRTEYMETLRQAILARELRLLIVIRIDFVDLLLNLCREVDPGGEAFAVGNHYVLQPFRETQALWVLREIFSPIVSGNGLLETRFASFAEALVNDLLQPPRDPRLCPSDAKTVLPAELQMVGQMIESLGVDQFTSRSFRELGGRNGLLKLYVEQAKSSVSRMGVPGDKALLILSILRKSISQDRIGSACSAWSIAQTLELPVSQVRRALEAFAELRLVNRVPKGSAGEGEDDRGMRYELMHEHLAQVLRDAGDPALEAAREAEERLHFWREREMPVDRGRDLSAPLRAWSLLRSAFAQPIPAFEALRLLRRANRTDRRMLLASLRGFLTRVMLAIVPVLLIILGMQSDAYQVHEAISESASLTLDPAAIMAVTSTNLRVQESAKATAVVVNDWTGALLGSGYAKQARQEVEGALSRSNQSSRANAYADFANVLLNTEEARILSAEGDYDHAANYFDSAQKYVDQMCSGYSSDVCFVAAAHLAEALGSIAKSPDQTERAVTAWNLALQTNDRRHLPELAGLFIISVRNIDRIVGADLTEREKLWNKAVDGVSKEYLPPYNCFALSEIAYELHKEGADAEADSLWKLAEEAAENFIAASPLAPVEQGRTSSASYRDKAHLQTPREPKRFQGILVESLHNADPSADRSNALLFLGSARYRVGEKEAAMELWRRCLDEAQNIGPPAGSPPTSPPSDIGIDASAHWPLQLPILETIGETLYRLRISSHSGDAALNKVSAKAELEILDVAKSRVEPCSNCVRALAASAGRLLGIDNEASNEAWRAALDAAREIKDSPGGERKLAARSAAPDTFLANKQSTPLQQMELALAGTTDTNVRSQAFLGVAYMLLGRRDVMQALRAVRAITDAQSRENFLADAAVSLLEGGEIDGAKLLANEIYNEALHTGDDRFRQECFAVAANLEAELGLFRQARQNCALTRQSSVVRQMACLTRILETYDSRGNDRLHASRERNSRYTLDWYVLPQY